MFFLEKTLIWKKYSFIKDKSSLDKMNFSEKILVKKISGSKESISEIDYKGIENFVMELDSKR